MTIDDQSHLADRDTEAAVNEPPKKEAARLVIGHSSRQRLSQRERIGLTHDDDDDEEEVRRHWMDGYCCQHYPRICSLFIGVLVPLWVLIFASLILGLFLNRAEAPEEGWLRKDEDYPLVLSVCEMIARISNRSTFACFLLL